MLTFLSLLFGTLVSEDLACVTAGVLIQRGQVEASSAVLACTLGIFAGDVGLWAIGRAGGRAVFQWPGAARRLQPHRFHEFRSWLDRHAGRAIVASRFLPGSRLPLYVIAGIVELPAVVFAGWALLGTLLWTPGLVLLTAISGDAFIGRIPSLIGSAWKADMVAAVVIVVFLRSIRARRSQVPVLADAPGR
jgi:membrane protein DedA with SNARE-associated domain